MQAGLASCVCAAVLLFNLAPTAAGIDVAAVVERVDESVLTVHIPALVGSGIGSAVIVSPQGHALTNAHVVYGSDEVRAELKNGRKIRARVLARDSRYDLALIHLASTNLPAATVGDSSDIRAGDSVVVIGAPSGLDQTVTSGIVSNAGRKVQGRTYLQTDAAVNPGNSGGPLFNERAELGGIVVAKHPHAEGVGLAIPINEAYGLLRRNGVAVSAPLSNKELAAKPAPLRRRLSDGTRGARPVPRPAVYAVTIGSVILAVALAVRAARMRRASGDIRIRLRKRRPRARWMPWKRTRLDRPARPSRPEVYGTPRKPRSEGEVDITLHGQSADE